MPKPTEDEVRGARSVLVRDIVRPSGAGSPRPTSPNERAPPHSTARSARTHSQGEDHIVSLEPEVMARVERLTEIQVRAREQHPRRPAHRHLGARR